MMAMCPAHRFSSFATESPWYDGHMANPISRIFLPLGMNNTVAYEEGSSTVTNRAFGYTMKDGVWTQKDQSTTSAVLGDGGIYSSIDDLAKWDAALYDSRLRDGSPW